MESNEQRPKPFVMPASARIGSLIGMTLWAVSIGIGLAAKGSPLLGLKIGGTFLGISLGAWSLGMRAMDEIDARRGSQAERLVVLWGFLLLVLGVVFLCFRHWAAPLIHADEAVASSRYATLELGALPSDLTSTLLIVLGALMLCLRRGSFPREGRAASGSSDGPDRGA